MFILFFKSKSIKKKIINKEQECLMCLESNNKVFYDYDYENNKYIHNCICRPNIHYLCFKENYKLKENCIICLKNIEFRPRRNLINFLINLIKFKLLLLLFILLYSIYDLIFNSDILNMSYDDKSFLRDENIYYV